MKKFFTVMFFSFALSFSAHSQLAVAIVSDSLPTIIHRIQEVMHFLDMVNNSVSQIKLASATVENQIAAIEKLSQGDWDGIVEAFDYQARTLDNFNGFIGGMDYLREFESFDVWLDTDKFSSFKEASSAIGESMNFASDAMWATSDLVGNSQMRMDRSREISDLSKASESTTKQMQLFNQQLTLVQGELTDLIQVGVAQNAFLASLEAEEDAENQLSSQQSEDYWNALGAEYDPVYTDDDFNDALYGKRY